jgi:DNA-binding MarR family transcriptional regulator
MPPTKAEIAQARKVWRLMFDFLMRTAPERAKALGRRGLTPNDSRALSSLRADEGRPMRALAEEWGCDASNATWMVDRLERLGLAERRVVPEDRRVKQVILTARGLKVRTELLEEFYAPPPRLAALGPKSLEALERQLRELSRPDLPGS